MDEGKQFELDFKKSVPPYALLYRLPDAAQSFAPSAKLRFSNKNPFDFILWDSQNRILYALELKTVSGKSISFDRTKDDKSKIHFHQIRGLQEWNKYDGVICGFIIEFRECDKCIFIDIDNFDKLTKSITKKSFNMKDLEQNNIEYSELARTLVRTHYRYDVISLLSEKGCKL